MPVSTDTPTDPKVYHGQESLVKIGDPIGSSPDWDVPLDSEDLETKIDSGSSTDFSAEIMDITITDPEATVEIQNTFGGQILTESPPDMVEVEFTMRFKDLEMLENLHGDTTSAASGSFNRINGTRDVGNKRRRAILFKLTKTVGGTTYTIHYLLNAAIFQQMGEISLEADGTAELTGTAVGLVENRYIEKNF